MSAIKNVVVGLAVVLSGTQAFAHDANVESLTYFEGAWRCAPADAPQDPQAEDLTVVQVKRVLGDWFTAKILKFGKASGEAVGTMTFDSHKNQFIEMGICDKGGYGWSMAPAWQNDTLTFVGHVHLNGNEEHFRKSFKKIDGESFEMTYETSADGKVFSDKKSAICKR